LQLCCYIRDEKEKHGEVKQIYIIINKYQIIK